MPEDDEGEVEEDKEGDAEEGEDEGEGEGVEDGEEGTGEQERGREMSGTTDCEGGQLRDLTTEGDTYSRRKRHRGVFAVRLFRKCRNSRRGWSSMMAGKMIATFSKKTNSHHARS